VWLSPAPDREQSKINHHAATESSAPSVPAHDFPSPRAHPASRAFSTTGLPPSRAQYHPIIDGHAPHRARRSLRRHIPLTPTSAPVAIAFVACISAPISARTPSSARERRVRPRYSICLDVRGFRVVVLVVVTTANARPRQQQDRAREGVTSNARGARASRNATPKAGTHYGVARDHQHSTGRCSF
jgi:hypothetical protein